MSNILTYRKCNPEETINIGDLIMIDHASGLVTKSKLELPQEMKLNTRLVIGVCTYSDNITPLNIIIDGGKAKEIDRVLVDGGKSEQVETILLCGGDSKINPREIIKLAYSGEQVISYSDDNGIIPREDDEVCICYEPGKVMVKPRRQLYFREEMRVVGIVKEVYEESKQVLVDLILE